MRRRAFGLAALCALVGCTEPERTPARPRQSPKTQPVPKERDVEGATTYNRIRVLQYQVQPPDTTYTLLTSELQRATRFVASNPWYRFSMRSGIVINGRDILYGYDLMQILNVLNPQHEQFTNTTALTAGETILFPDLNEDRIINGQQGAQQGELAFTGAVNQRLQPLYIEFSYEKRHRVFQKK